MNEVVWKDVPDVPWYQVSNDGRVKSLPRTVVKPRPNRQPFVMHVKGGELVTPINKGYKVVKLGTYTKSVGVHQLMMRAFVGHPNGLVVNHKDGNKLNNTLENLEYVTNSENVLHAHKNGLMNYKKRKFNGR
jgi:hypothetical protein